MALKQEDPRLSILKDISPLLTCSLDTDLVLEIIIVTVTNLMEAKASSLLLLDRNRDVLYFELATGEKGEEVKKFEVKVGKGIAGHVAKTGDPILVKDVASSELWDSTIAEATGFKTRSIACTPIKIQNDVIGVIEIIDREDGKPIKASDMDLLNSFAELASAVIERSRKYTELKNENTCLKRTMESRYEIVGKSPGIQKVIRDSMKVANSRTTTLITGESGTGKELIARLIHRLGPRKNKKLNVVNCAALPDTLLESELFGYVRGAFTGAVGNKIGVLEATNHGTLFMDEVAEMSPSMQAKLLRVLQEGTYQMLGSTVTKTVDIRVIAATNKNLTDVVDQGGFREDLYYRLNVINIEIPPLRERRDDIEALARYFVKKYCLELGRKEMGLHDDTLEPLTSYHWPGNVRELENAIERAVVMSEGDLIHPEDLPIGGPKGWAAVDDMVGAQLKDAVESFRTAFIQKTLDHCQGSVKNAAALLGVQRTYLSRLIGRYGLRTARSGAAKRRAS